MGQALSFGLTQYDVEELKDHSGGKLTQAEIEGLYKRFRTLDRGHKGYLSTGEFASIPELSINPLHQRLGQIFSEVNFKEFVEALVCCSKRATREDRLARIFSVFDVDGDGVISREDLELMVRQLAGSTFTDEQVQATVNAALKEGGSQAAGLTYEDMAGVLEGRDLDMTVEMPTDE
ncbi:hypothetical protein WJX81_003956 [Elliptochloris bilobata]|uniref:EF-hand domain-containing protein n=1 Tax=Elliptochloris bilobata TaxID=381761 RepID=A0AAW1SI64_9CHLO